MPSHTPRKPPPKRPPPSVKLGSSVKLKKKKKKITVDADAVQRVGGRSGVRPRPRRGEASAVSIEARLQRRRIRLHTVDKAELSDLSSDEDEVSRHPPQRTEDFEDRVAQFMQIISANKRRVILKAKADGIIAPPAPAPVKERPSYATSNVILPTREEILTEHMPTTPPKTTPRTPEGLRLIEF